MKSDRGALSDPLAARLVDAARVARENAYAPYSGFRVGAAVLTDQGEIACGCNVENASYGLTLCAERVAVGSAVARGCECVVAVAVYSEGDELVWPCGACRQVLLEFGPDATVIAATSSCVERRCLKELLPDAFGRESLGRQEGDAPA